MLPTRQVHLTFALAHPFLDSVFADDEEGALWLSAEVGVQEDDVTAESAE